MPANVTSFVQPQGRSAAPGYYHCGQISWYTRNGRYIPSVGQGVLQSARGPVEEHGATEN